MRSSIPFFADGFAYDVSVIDPVAVDGTDGTLRLFFASADGDADHGIARDGRHDCGIYSSFGPTAPYLGTGIYEALVEPRVLRPTTTTIEPYADRLIVRVSAPTGNVVIADNDSFVIAPLVNGVASINLAPGDHRLYAWYDAQGQWDASRSPTIMRRVTPARRRAAR